MKIDHIAIAVNDVEASAKVYQKALGIDGASQLFAPIFLASSLIITEYL